MLQLRFVLEFTKPHFNIEHFLQRITIVLYYEIHVPLLFVQLIKLNNIRN